MAQTQITSVIYNKDPRDPNIARSGAPEVRVACSASCRQCLLRAMRFHESTNRCNPPCRIDPIFVDGVKVGEVESCGPYQLSLGYLIDTCKNCPEVCAGRTPAEIHQSLKNDCVGCPGQPAYDACCAAKDDISERAIQCYFNHYAANGGCNCPGNDINNCTCEELASYHNGGPNGKCMKHSGIIRDYRRKIRNYMTENCPSCIGKDPYAGQPSPTPVDDPPSELPPVEKTVCCTEQGIVTNDGALYVEYIDCREATVDNPCYESVTPIPPESVPPGVGPQPRDNWSYVYVSTVAKTVDVPVATDGTPINACLAAQCYGNRTFPPGHITDPSSPFEPESPDELEVECPDTQGDDEPPLDTPDDPKGVCCTRIIDVYEDGHEEDFIRLCDYIPESECDVGCCRQLVVPPSNQEQGVVRRYGNRTFTECSGDQCCKTLCPTQYAF